MSRFVFSGLLLVVLSFVFSGCGIIQKKETPTQPDVTQIVADPLPPEQTGELLSDIGGNWFYGQGLGDTAIAAGTVVAFPPYAIALVGNAILSLSGYETIGVSDFLPGQAAEYWIAGYDSVASAPGRVTSTVAGEEYRTQEVIRERMEKYLPEEPGEPTQVAIQPEFLGELEAG